LRQREHVGLRFDACAIAFARLNATNHERFLTGSGSLSEQQWSNQQFMRPITCAKAWNSAWAAEKARALTWINALRLPPAQTTPVPSAIRQAIAGERKEETAMENAKLSRSPNLTKTIIIGGSAALAAAVLFAGLAVAPRSASALPAYAQKEGKACGYCHTNAAGGGPRNARGQQYEAGGHSFKKK
jgi:hypothetical protein